MDLITKNIRRENLRKELQAAQTMAAEIEQELRESSETNRLSLQNVYDSASDERDLKAKIKLHQFVQSRIRSIQRTIHAMESGTYGVCGDCGCEIDQRRLAVSPESVLCISCQSDLESQERLEKERFVSTAGLQQIRFLPLAA